MAIKRLRLVALMALALAISATFLPSVPTYAQESEREVIVLEASSVVLPALGTYIERGLKEADERNAEAVVIVLDTPGGSLDTTFIIVQAIRTSDVPVIVFVGPRGASAASAGLLITLAGHAAAMAPETAIGASSPVTSQGTDLPSTAEQKAMQFVSAQARGLAERRGEAAVELADAAVTEARAVSSREALDAGLIDLIIEDVDSLLAEVDGMVVEVNGRSRTLHTAGAATVTLPMSVLERTLIALTHPMIVSTLLLLGPTLILIEVRSPGGWVAGAVGTIFTGLALYGLGVLPVNYLGLVFVGLALALFILEVKAPVHGVLTGAGAASLAVGIIILFNQPELAPFGRISIPLVIAQSVVMAAIFFFIAMMGLRAQWKRPATGYPALVGQVGRVTRDLNPIGMVQVFGERWRAASADGAPIPEGEAVEVIEAGKMRLLVRRTSAAGIERSAEELQPH